MCTVCMCVAWVCTGLHATCACVNDSVCVRVCSGRAASFLPARVVSEQTKLPVHPGHRPGFLSGRTWESTGAKKPCKHSDPSQLRIVLGSVYSPGTLRLARLTVAAGNLEREAVTQPSFADSQLLTPGCSFLVSCRTPKHPALALKGIAVCWIGLATSLPFADIGDISGALGSWECPLGTHGREGYHGQLPPLTPIFACF